MPTTLPRLAATDTRFSNSLETPRSLITKSAAAQSKQECLQIFPNNPTGTTGQRSQRIIEPQSCLNQWNDYTPSLLRNFMNTQADQRYAIDERVDYRLTDQLTVFAKGTMANRKVNDQNRSRNPASLLSQNAAGTFIDSVTGYPRTRTVSPTAPAGYYRYDGLNNVGNNAKIGNILGCVAKVWQPFANGGEVQEACEG